MPFKITAAVAGISAATWAALQTVRAPESIWPITVTGWVSLFLSCASAIGVVYALHRMTLKPVIQSIKETKDSVKEVQNHFDKVAEDVEKRVNDKIDIELNRFSQAVEARLNGFGATQNSQAGDIRVLSAAQSQFASAMASSIEDRRHINYALQQILMGQDDVRKSNILFERQVLAMIADLSKP